VRSENFERCEPESNDCTIAVYAKPTRDTPFVTKRREIVRKNRASLKEGAGKMKCSEIMTPSPVYCLPTYSAYQVALLMKSEDVGSIPVVKNRQDRRLTGIVTDRDLALKVVAEGRDPYDTLVEDVKSLDIITCEAADDLDEVLKLMERYQLRRIPVVDSDHQLIGIISQADVATRIGEPEKTAEVVSEISRAAGAAP
jgi:CBS domain-containing protein